MQADDQFTAGVPVTLAPGLVRVVAPNASPMTGPGTNTYILGTDSLAIIDPGPDDLTHKAALSTAIGARPVSHIIVTHSHLDHSPLAKPLGAQFDAPVVAFGPTFAGRSAVMTQLAQNGLTGGGEGLDHAFEPDVVVADGDQIVGDGWTLDVMHTPGHLGNHISLMWGDAVFVGDHVMAWSTSLVSPPDGDMQDFLTSCERLKALNAKVLYPGHGVPVTEPSKRLAALIAHRQARTDAILKVLGKGPARVSALVDLIYEDLQPGLHPAAARNVFAHLIALHTNGKVTAHPQLQATATFALAGL